MKRCLWLLVLCLAIGCPSGWRNRNAHYANLRVGDSFEPDSLCRCIYEDRSLKIYSVQFNGLRGATSITVRDGKVDSISRR